MTKPFRIRPARATDSASAATVVKAVFEEYGFTWDAEDYCADLYDLQGHYLDQGNYFWVAEDTGSGEVVGTTALDLFPKLSGAIGELTMEGGTVRIGGADCSLERLYVHPFARRGGLGTSLLATTVRQALELGRTTLEIWSDKKLTKAHALYEKYGAIQVGDRICSDPDHSPEWGMVLEIKPRLLELLESGWA